MLKDILENDTRSDCEILDASLWDIGRFAIARAGSTAVGLEHLIGHFQDVLRQLQAYEPPDRLH